MGDIPVTYYVEGGAHIKGALRLDERGVGMLFGKKKSGGNSPDQVHRISFDDPGRTKANGAALVMFGVLGLAARRAFTIITVSVAERDLYFESSLPLGTWRASAPRIIEDVPWTAGRLAIDGAVLGANQPGHHPSPIDQLRQLAELRDAGIVTQEEFEAKKAELLNRL